MSLLPRILVMAGLMGLASLAYLTLVRFVAKDEMADLTHIFGEVFRRVRLKAPSAV
jgi:hypothetical protein